MGSGNSRLSTMESMMTLHAGVCAEQSLPDAGLPGTAMAKVVKSNASGNGKGGINGGGNEGRMQSNRFDEVSGLPPPAI